MSYMLYAVLAGFGALVIVYFKNRGKHVVTNGGERKKMAVASGSDIGDFIQNHKHPYILDIRPDEMAQDKGLRHSNSLIIMYIPFVEGQEYAFVQNVFTDSRMRTAREEKQDIFILCDSRAHGSRVYALLLERGFNPTHLYDNLDDAPAEYVRFSTRRK